MTQRIENITFTFHDDIVIALVALSDGSERRGIANYLSEYPIDGQVEAVRVAVTDLDPDGMLATAPPVGEDE